MSPIRLFVLAVLFYIAWRLIRGSLGNKSTTGRQQQTGASEVKDVLVEDPVCHTLIPKSQAIRCRRDGKTHYFCSEKCCDTFTRESGGEK
ncbi:MAG TPA: YHS domain-containing protein [Desulfobulbaceae bacterium]|nr:YHS domain-containing protein [Desulfobulbaceae bacterium]